MERYRDIDGDFGIIGYEIGSVLLKFGSIIIGIFTHMPVLVPRTSNR